MGQPHESPRSMTRAADGLGGGVAVVGFLGSPAVLGEKAELVGKFSAVADAGGGGVGGGAHELGAGWKSGLMLFSVAMVARRGGCLARKWYGKDPEWKRARAFTAAFPRLYKTVFNKYYVDEIYAATAVSGTLETSQACASFDANVVDGTVNGVRHATVGTSLLSGIFDLTVIDGLVNLAAWINKACGNLFRKVQTGVVQNYVFVFALGVFLSLGVYLFIK